MNHINHYLIGERIKTERKKQKLTQAKLAELIDISTNYIGCMECGCKQGSFNAYFKIVESLGISFDTILVDVLKLKENTEEYALLKTFRQLTDTDKRFALKILEEIKSAHN